MPITRRGFLFLSTGALTTPTIRAADPASEVTIAIMGLRVRAISSRSIFSTFRISGSLTYAISTIRSSARR